jgi:alpha-amylase/alpha-mannosidase (GH57 family)
MTALIVHGHFYQPPRENPWTGMVEREFGADPYHDWNERIHAECYAPNAQAQILGAHATVERRVNNYEKISFNFGPTLLSWLELHYPETYSRILEADLVSRKARDGHGNAIAQAYGHAILPLASDRDRLTQVVWGISDFRHRFRREPESLWLPETACDNRTLDLLIEQQLRFVILAPTQAARIRAAGGEWKAIDNGSIDTTNAYRYFHQDGSGRSIAIFFYDGPTARAIAFEKALVSSAALVAVFKRAAARVSLVNVATDGETYGHHFKFGDLCLAHTLEIEAPDEGFVITNYGQYLDQHPAELQVQIDEGPDGKGTSWSCAHGVGRWFRDCGCSTGGEQGWTQAWRGPLRAALNFVGDAAARHFETFGSDVFVHPWAARNASIELILDPQRSREEFLHRQAGRQLSATERVRALTLLEMQRNALLMFTSCGWFFSEISGIETIQVMKYAARVIELLDDLGAPSPRAEFLEMLAEAGSNLKDKGTGADVYLRYAEPPSVTAKQIDDAEAKLS